VKPQMLTDAHRFLRLGLVACRWLALSNVEGSLAAAWRFLRAVSGDDAYEVYLSDQGQSTRHEALLSASDFYLSRLNHKYSRPTRCC